MKQFGWTLNLLEWWFTSVSNIMMKNFVYIGNKTPFTTHAQCEIPKPYMLLSYRNLKNVIHQTDSKNE